MIINNPDLIKNYVDVTKTDLLASKKTLNLNKNVTPILDISPKRYTDVFYDTATTPGTNWLIPAKQTFYMTYAWANAVTPDANGAYVVINDNYYAKKIVFARVATGTLDTAAVTTALSFNPPIKVLSGWTISPNGEAGFGGYFEDIY